MAEKINVNYSMGFFWIDSEKNTFNSLQYSKKAFYSLH